MPTSAADKVQATNSPHGGTGVRDFPNTIVQTLDAWLPDAKAPDATYYPKEVFQQNVDSWNGCPLVFSESGRHPDLNKFADPATRQEALDEIGGELAGEMTDAMVDLGGQARLRGNLHITHKRALELWDAGNLSPSSAFGCQTAVNSDGKKGVVGNIKPNHILLFPRDHANPRDRGTHILNSEPADGGNVTKDGKIKAALDALAAAIFPPSDEKNDAATNSKQEKNMANETDTQKHADVGALEARVAELEQENATLKAENAKLKGEATASEKKHSELAEKVSKFEQAEKDATWTAIKNTLPKGMTATPEAESELRTLAENNPAAFSLRLAEAKITNSTSKAGNDKHGDTGKEDDGNSYTAIRAEFNRAIGKQVIG